MKLIWYIATLSLLCGIAVAQEFKVAVPHFPATLPSDWTFKRETAEGWKLSEGELQLRVLPGNMWGSANDARNVLLIPAGDPEGSEWTVTVKVENRPTEQYEQVDLVWYYSDSHMVKIGLEQVDGRLCIVMGREEADRTRTLAIHPSEHTRVRLKLTVQGDRLIGDYQFPEETEWRRAGECTLPGTGRASISLQAYQGPKDQVRWARLTEFKLTHRELP